MPHMMIKATKFLIRKTKQNKMTLMRKCRVLFLRMNSCKKNTTSDGKARLQVFLTDDPGDYEAVYIDVDDVQINVTGDDTNGWQSLKGVNAGVYDLLKLVNDEDTILADAEIPSGRLHQIRHASQRDAQRFRKTPGRPGLL